MLRLQYHYLGQIAELRKLASTEFILAEQSGHFCVQICLINRISPPKDINGDKWIQKHVMTFYYQILLYFTLAFKRQFTCFSLRLISVLNSDKTTIQKVTQMYFSINLMGVFGSEYLSMQGSEKMISLDRV